jgi:tetratricopeptide (TPR) repeat protein
MDEFLREQIYNNLSLRETEDLLDIYHRKNTHEWDEETFEIIKEILLQRLGTIPDEPVQEQGEEKQDSGEEEQGTELDEAIHAAELAIQKAPRRAAGYYRRGLVHDEMGQLENSLADYREAISLDPDFEDAWINFFIVEKELEEKYHRSATKKHLDRALEFANHKETVKALTECEFAKKNMPELATVYNDLGMTLEELEHLAASLEAYLKATSLNPRFYEAWENLEDVEVELTYRFQNSSAKQHLDRALAYIEADKPEKALEECELAKSAMAGMALAYNYLGLILQELGQTEMAIAAYFEAGRLNPKFYAARENLANARVKLEEEHYHRPDLGNLDDRNGEHEGDSDYQNPVPGWVYLSEPSFLLTGWPGHRTRPGRSGYDPLDTDFENAHLEGVMIRMAFTGRFRTHNPLYLLLMSFVGFLLSTPIFLVGPAILQGETNSIYPLFLIIFSPYWIVGAAVLINVYLSLTSVGPDEDDEKGKTFY